MLDVELREGRRDAFHRLKRVRRVRGCRGMSWTRQERRVKLENAKY
jgi:hypothetical protein